MDPATLVRPGATVVKSVPLSDPNAHGPGQLVVQSQSPGTDGCPQPYLDVYRADPSGRWISVWDATQQPSVDRALLPHVLKSGDQCVPAIETLRVQPLVAHGPWYALATIVADARGTRRLIAFSVEDPTTPVTLADNLTTSTGATIALSEVADGKPLAITLQENAYAADDSGVNGGYDQPIGRYSQVLTWDDAGKTFQPGRATVAPNCMKGTITRLGAAALQVQCGDDHYTAVAVGDRTTYASDRVTFAELQVGDGVTFAVDDATLTADSAYHALPTATQVIDPQAQDRTAVTPTPTHPTGGSTPGNTTGTAGTPVPPRVTVVSTPVKPNTPDVPTPQPTSPGGIATPGGSSTGVTTGGPSTGITTGVATPGGPTTGVTTGGPTPGGPTTGVTTGGPAPGGSSTGVTTGR